MGDGKDCEFIDPAELSLSSTPEYKFGSVTDVIGGHGPWQFRHWFVFFLASIFNVMLLFSDSLLFHEQCLMSNNSAGLMGNESKELTSLKNVSDLVNKICNSSLCQDSKYNLTNEYTEDFNSLVQQCSTNWTAVVNAKYIYVGSCLISIVTFQPVKLRLGRRPVSLISCVLWMGCSMASAFLYDFKLYLILFSFATFGVMNIYLASLMSLMECLSDEYKLLYLIFGQLSWGVAHFLLPLFIWIGSGWFGFHTIMCVGSIFLLALLCFVPESAEYYVQRGQWSNACKTLKIAAISNGFSPTRLEAFSQHWMLKEEKDYIGKKILPKSYLLTLKLVLLFFSSFMTSFLYLTLSYQVDWIGARVGSNLALMGTSEVSSTIILLFVTCLVPLKYLWSISSIMASVCMLVAYSKLHDVGTTTISTYLFLAMIFFAFSAWTLLLLRSVIPPANSSKWSTITIYVAVCIGAVFASALDYKKNVQDLEYIPLIVWAVPHFLIGACTVFIPDIEQL